MGPPYFNIVIVPLMIPLFLIMAIGPLLSWRRGDLPGAWSRLKFALGATIVAFGATLFGAGLSTQSLLVSLAFGLAAWVIVGSITEWAVRVGLFRRSIADAFHRALYLPRSAYGMTISHIGLAIVLIGIAGSLSLAD